MHVHIVYCHPSEDSLTAKIRDAFIAGLVDTGKTYSISDLYKMNFKSDMSEEEYLRDAYYSRDLPLPDDVYAEHERINASDALVFIYPVFWTEAPAKLVGWFDRVWSYGFAYCADEGEEELGGQTEGKNFVKPMKTLSKALVIACAGNTEERLVEQSRLQSMKNVMLDDRIFDRAAEKEFVLLGGTERGNIELREAMSKQHPHTAYRLASEL